MAEKVMIYKISEFKGGPSFCVEYEENAMAEIQAFFDYAEPGHTIHVEVVMMDREEFHGLPEFDGF